VANPVIAPWPIVVVVVWVGVVVAVVVGDNRRET
jgi:hypothetical protein